MASVIDFVTQLNNINRKDSNKYCNLKTRLSCHFK